MLKEYRPKLDLAHFIEMRIYSLIFSSLLLFRFLEKGEENIGRAKYRVIFKEKYIFHCIDK